MPELGPARRRIFVVGPTESLLTRRGTRHPALARFLVARGHELEYVTSDFYHAEKRWFGPEEVARARARAPYRLTVMRCLGYRRNLSVRRAVSNLLFAARVFAYLLPRVDRGSVLVLPSRPVEVIFAAGMLRLLRRTSVLLDIQDVWPDMFPMQSRVQRRLFTLYCNAFLYPSLPVIDSFVHIAPSFTGWLRRYAPRRRSTFVPLGFDSDRWPATAPADARSPGSPIQLVCVAQLTRVFDVMPVLEAITGDDRFHLTLIGDDGHGERYPDVMAYIDRHRMDNVTVAGSVAPDSMAERLAGMDIGIVPMRVSSIPNKVFDYIGAWLPVLVLGENDAAEFVEELGIGWRCPFDAPAVRTLLARFTAPEIEEKCARLGTVRSRFDRRNLYPVIHDLVEKGRGTDG